MLSGVYRGLGQRFQGHGENRPATRGWIAAFMSQEPGQLTW
jgi:hypothetical protein